MLNTDVKSFKVSVIWSMRNVLQQHLDLPKTEIKKNIEFKNSTDSYLTRNEENIFFSLFWFNFIEKKDRKTLSVWPVVAHSTNKSDFSEQ